MYIILKMLLALYFFTCLYLPFFLSFLQTSSFFLHIFKVQMIDRKVILGGKQSSGLSLATISLVLSEKAPFSDKNLTMCVFFSGIDL